ncbi:response regulator [Daejeonella sp. H1SJ63]|jgi:CheY-like chemotaxis protein|uniref:response regulator n=1 Tax=Daejeonella sp. H1SJ63 TaxID=3034145 RepID=UPI0023EE15B3|nr:response regulator [Daejeonella sp. H1SJ63]
MSAPFPHFIIIDDSQLDCFIAEKIIQNTGTFSSVKSYTEATDALESIKDLGEKIDAVTIIVLDIQMPLMNGFQFVEAFEQLPSEVQSNYAIFMFSSSINENDKNRMENYPSIRRFYGKPISKDTVARMIEQL